MWSTIEVVRFAFYTVKMSKELSEGALGTALGYIRYNIFIPVYPTGVAGELLAVYFALQTVEKMLVKPYSIKMPNPYNIAFDFQMFMQSAPILYVLGFPVLYLHMFSQRSRFHEEQEDKRKISKI